MASNDNSVPLRRLSGEDCRRISSDQVITSVPSVVKELVENALDAKATRISISLKGFGFEVIEVQDNGCGINKEDREKLGLRHFTSKLRSFRDLEDGKCRSYGFRGEAINSLCEQSREVVFQTKVRREPTADRMLMDKRGHKVSITKVPQASCGSIVRILGLFSSRPVRIPKAKGKEKQEAEVVNLFLEYCLSNPHVFFQLRTSKKYLFRGREKTNNLSKPPLSTRSEVFKQLFGTDVHQELQLLEWELEVNEMEEEEEVDEDKQKENEEREQGGKKQRDESVPVGSNIQRIGATETLPDAKMGQHQSRGKHAVRSALVRATATDPTKFSGIEGSDRNARENDDKRFQDTLASLSTYQASTEHIDVVGDGSAACLSTKSKLVENHPQQSLMHVARTRSIDEARLVVNKSNTTHSPSFRYSIVALLPKADGDASLCTRSDSSRLFTFINNRPVTLPSLHSLLARHYRSLFEARQHGAACKSAGSMSFKRRFPVGLVSIQADAAAVDVNVTPDKRVVAMVGAKQLLRSFSQQLRKHYPLYQQNRQLKQRPRQIEGSEQTMTERSEDPLSLHSGQSEMEAAVQVTSSELPSRDSRSVESSQGLRSLGSENLTNSRQRDSEEPSDGTSLTEKSTCASSLVVARPVERNGMETQESHVNAYAEAAYTPTRRRVRSRVDLLSTTASMESETEEFKRKVTQVLERGKDEQSSGDEEVTCDHMDLERTEQTPRDWANICQEVYKDMISDSGSDTDELIEEDHEKMGGARPRPQARKAEKPKTVLENADDNRESPPPVSILTGHRGRSLRVLPGCVMKQCTSSLEPAQQIRPLRSYFPTSPTYGRQPCAVHTQNDRKSARDDEDKSSVQDSARHFPSKIAVDECDVAEGPSPSHGRITEKASVDYGYQQGHDGHAVKGSPSLDRHKVRNRKKREDIRQAVEYQAMCSAESEASEQTLQQSKDCGPSNFASAFRELSVGSIPHQRHAICSVRKPSESTSAPHSPPSFCGESRASQCIPSSIESVSAPPLALETGGAEARPARGVVVLDNEAGLYSNKLYDHDKRVLNNEAGLHSETLYDSGKRIPNVEAGLHSDTRNGSGTRVPDDDTWAPSETLNDSDKRVLNDEAGMHSEALYDSDKRVRRDSKAWINEVGEEIIDTDELSQSLQSPPSFFSGTPAGACGDTAAAVEARQGVLEDDDAGQGLLGGVGAGSVLTEGPSKNARAREDPLENSEDVRDIENGGKFVKDSGELTNFDRSNIDDEHQKTTDADTLGFTEKYRYETECPRRTAVRHVVDTGQFFEEYRANAWHASRGETGLGEVGEIPKTLMIGRVSFSSGCSSSSSSYSYSCSSSSPPLSSSSSSFSSAGEPPRKKSRLRLRSDRKKDREQRSANASFTLSDHPPRCYVARVGDALYAIADHQRLYTLKERSERRKPVAQTLFSGTKEMSEGSTPSLANSEPLELLRSIVEVTTGQENTILRVNDLCKANVIVHLCQRPAANPT